MPAIAQNSSDEQPVMVTFKDDTSTTVSRGTLKLLANELGLNESQTVLFALARLRDEVLVDKGPVGFDMEPLTSAQNAVLRKVAPKIRGKVLSTLLP